MTDPDVVDPSILAGVPFEPVSVSVTKKYLSAVWAMAACAFWGMMHFGEVSVPLCNAFDGKKHLTHQDTHFGYDLDGRLYVHLNLPSAKIAKSGEIQSVFMVPQEGLCPLKALQNLAKVVPAGQSDPLFSWQDRQGNIRKI